MRKILILLGALVCGPALAQTTMNPSDKAPGITLSGGNLTVSDTLGKVYCVAVDFSAKTVWIFSFYEQEWTGSSNTSGDPSTNSLGYDISAHGTGTIYPAVGAFNGSGLAYRVDGDAADCLAHAGSLSGFTSWNTAAGGTLTWDSAKKDSNITLSGSDAIATWASGAGEGTVMGTTGIALGGSAKAVFQLYHYGSFTAASHNVGISLSTFSTADKCGENSSADSSCYWYQGAWYRNGVNNSVTETRLDDQGYGRFVRSTTAVSGGAKRCFEVTANTISSQTSAQSVGFGIARSTADLTNNDSSVQRSYIGGDSLAYGGGTDGVIYNNATSTGIDFGAIAAATTYMACVDTTNEKLWVWSPTLNQWNGAVIGSQNPATNTGGVAITAGQSWYAAVQVATADAGSSLTVNFGASAFSNSIPSGFTSWDPPPAGNRGYIFGANENFPGWFDMPNRCERAA